MVRPAALVRPAAVVKEVVAADAHVPTLTKPTLTPTQDNSRPVSTAPPTAIVALSTGGSSSSSSHASTNGVNNNIGAAVKSPGCGKEARAGGETKMGPWTVTVDLPDGYDKDKPNRLFIAYPWAGGNMHVLVDGSTVKTPQPRGWAYYGVKAAMSSKDTIFVAVQGKTDPPDPLKMLEDLEAAYCIDTARIFATGFSMGGVSSYQIACQYASKFRAAIPLSGARDAPCMTPIAIMISHGLRDVLFKVKDAVAHAAEFAKLNGCEPASPPLPAEGSLKHTVYDYKGCKPGLPVRLVVFDAAHYADPGDGTDHDDGVHGFVPGLTAEFINQF